MGWSLRIARFAGIDVYVHWTFLLLLGWVFYRQLGAGGSAGVAAGLAEVLFVLGVFLCVLLHEFGHALAAARLGIGTRHITLLPIGGIAMLERMPRRPSHELIIAAAGPAVNVIIAAVLLAGLALAGQRTPGVLSIAGGEFALRLLIVNVLLVLFNLIPAIPMDGGRVLRALLAMGMTHARATLIAGRVGQVVAAGFAIVAIVMFQPLLFLIALLVYTGASAEIAAARAATLPRVAADAALRGVFALDESRPLEDLAAVPARYPQPLYPVLRSGAPVGMVLFTAFAEGVRAPLPGQVVADLPLVDFPVVPGDTPLPETIGMLQDGNWIALPVTDARGDFLGVITLAAIAAAMGYRRTGPPAAR